MRKSEWKLYSPSSNNGGTLHIQGSNISSNHTGYGAGGGGISNEVGNITINQSAIIGNTIGYGAQGAGIIDGIGTLYMTNVTISGNSSGEAGNASGISSFGNGLLENVTIANNSGAANESNKYGVHIGGTNMEIKNSLIANNDGRNCNYISPNSLGHNLSSDNSNCNFNGEGDLNNIDPMLGPLQDNGGNTLTHALLAGSPAIDTGANVGCPTTDQRGSGFPRPIDGDGNGSTICDIGAYEVQPPPNQAPTANAGGPYNVNEGDQAALSGSGTDPDSGDTLTYAWDLDNNGSFETSGQNVTFSAAGLDGPSSKTVVLQVCDNHNACDTSNGTVNITNVAPTVSNITAPTDPVQVNTSINTSATFTDPGTPDTHTAIWDWGDGSTSIGTVTESNGSGSVSGSHTYTAAGVYSIGLTVTDDDGGTATSNHMYVVVYDPNGDSLKGSGKYDSIAGWYIPNSQAQGDVKFGIQAAYSGGTVPTGKTKLNFKNANLDFQSTSYQWLVVSGDKATLKGNGTINGTGNYTFIASGIDGSPDTIRFQIKDSSGNVIYDTQAGAGDTADPTTPLTNGSIKIH